MAIDSDNDMPKCLNTPTKQAKKARQLVETHFNTKTKRAKGPRIQGFFSRTMFVDLQNGEEVVVQFRPEPLDTSTFEIARTVLGPVVPKVELLEDDEMKEVNIWPYLMNRIPGETWLSTIRETNSGSLVNANRSLARIFSKGRIRDGDTEAAIEKVVRPHLQLIATSNDKQISRFSSAAAKFLGELDKIKTLPLFVTHFDLNYVNILVQKDGEVSGLVDWELSVPLPFGMGFERIHTLAGEFSEGKFYMPPEFEEAERGFWKEIYDRVDADVREILDTTPDLVQTALHIGVLCHTFELEDGKLEGYHSASLNSLEKFLSYRLPFCRGNDQPYSL